MALTQVQSGMLNADSQNYGFKNRIINGAMTIDQRNAGASVTPAIIGNTYTLDRWEYSASQASKASLQQSSTAQVGFINSLLVTSLSAYTVGAAEIFTIRQKIEGLNITDLAWGTANAKTVTLSFQVYSSLTGTFGGSLQNSGFGRSHPFTYSISTANTWTTISITVAGDTSGTWLTTSGIGLIVNFGLGVGATSSGTANAWASADYRSATGAVSVVGTSGATFYITGVQLEVGTVATSFDFRPIGTELELCQRYYVRWNASDAFSYFTSGLCFDNVSAVVALSNPVQMRAQPTWGTPSNCRLYNGLTAAAITSISVNRSSVLVSSGNFTTTAGTFTASNPVVVSANNNSAAYLEVTAEL